MSEEQIKKQIQSLYKKIETNKKRRTITCPECKHKTRVANATVIRDWYYIPPSGCTEGAYWTFDDTEYFYFCHNCKKCTRTFIHRHYDYDKKGYVNEEKPKNNKRGDITRLKLYYSIHDNINCVGEILNSYNDISKGTTLEALREKKKREEESKHSYEY